MTALLSAELLKLRTTRAFYVLLALVVVFAAGLPFLGAALAGGPDTADLTARSLLDIVRGPVQPTGGAVLLLGLFLSAGEFRHRTVLVSRLAEPRPLRLLAAKLTAAALLGLVAGVLIEVLSLASGAVVLHQEGLPFQLSSYDIPRVLLVVPPMLALYGVFGVAVGALARGTAGAVGAVMVWAFVLEGVVPVVTGAPHLGDKLPSGAFKALLSTSGPVSPGLAAVLLVAYGAAIVLAAGASERLREL
jgi:ABC-2 type transport system permease protein